MRINESSIQENRYEWDKRNELSFALALLAAPDGPLRGKLEGGTICYQKKRVRPDESISENGERQILTVSANISKNGERHTLSMSESVTNDIGKEKRQLPAVLTIRKKNR